MAPLKECSSGWARTIRLRIVAARPLHHGAELPGRELVVAVAERLALALAARGGGEDELEDALAAGLDRFLAVDDGAAIQIHVVGHALEERGIGGELERGGGLAAIGRAAAGGEADEIGAARD